MEIGCGVGALLEDFSRMGFVCDAVESSEAAFRFACSLYADNRSVTIHTQLRDDWDGEFDSVMAFEVLEHIKDDGKALARWRRCLKPGGRLIISVPAHQSKWDASDVWAGHFRRYEKSQLKSLLGALGDVLANELTFDVIEEYKCQRIAEGRARETINRELGGLSKGLKIAVAAKKLEAFGG